MVGYIFIGERGDHGHVSRNKVIENKRKRAQMREDKISNFNKLPLSSTLLQRATLMLQVVIKRKSKTKTCKLVMGLKSRKV